MRLTRRDAVAALAAAGVVVGGGAAVLGRDGDRRQDGPPDPETTETVLAAADVLYPEGVREVEPFVRRYLRGRLGDDPERAAALADAVSYLNAYTEAWYDEAFAALPVEDRDEALRRMGADEADPDPAGSDVERVRHYVINELLFALYASPTGGKLVGLENPQGHPGGIQSYRRGPEP